MTEILGILLPDASCNVSKMSALINNERDDHLPPTGCLGESSILLHNLESIPSSCLQKKSVIHALHGFGDQAIMITMNYSKTMKLVSINCPSLSNTCKFVGHQQLSYSTGGTKKWLLNARALIALPPFILSKLMDIPGQSVNHVLWTVLQTLTDHDQKMQ
jgi:hypothetical protein